METWKEIVGFPGYEISDQGRVRSWWVWGRYGLKSVKPRILKLGADKDGYKDVGIYGPDRKQKWRRVHKLVLEAFVGPCPKGMETCHKDGNRVNNKLGNLRWDTNARNHQDRVKHGTAKLTDADVLEIKRLKKEGFAQTKIARQFKIDPSIVSRIISGARLRRA